MLLMKSTLCSYFVKLLYSFFNHFANRFYFGNTLFRIRKSLKEKLARLQMTEKNRICFGKSEIHGWGLFARQKILEGEMVLEYRGELVRRSVAGFEGEAISI